MKSNNPTVISGIGSILILFAFTAGCVFSNENTAEKSPPYTIDAWCEIQEFNLSIVHNRTVVPVTEDDLGAYPDFGKYLMNISNTPPTENTGTRLVTVFDCNSSRAAGFSALYRKYEEFPHQPVLEYRGHFYTLDCEYLKSHSTAGPTIVPGG